MKKVKKDIFIEDVYFEESNGKVYKVCVYRDKKGETQVSRTIYNPGQYKIENRSTLDGLITSIEKGFKFSMGQIIENIEQPENTQRYINQLQSYGEKLIKTYAKYNKELSQEEIESMATEKLTELIINYFKEKFGDKEGKAVDYILEKTNSDILKNALVYFMSEEISVE